MDRFHSTSLSVRCGYPRAAEVANSKLEGFELTAFLFFFFLGYKNSYKMTERGMER